MTIHPPSSRPSTILPRSIDSQPLLELRNLSTYFYTEEGVVKAVDGLDYTVHKGEVFGLVGESGCGKTVSALSVLRLVDAPGKIVAGEIVFDGVPLLELSEKEMTKLRGSRISMIFQEPLASLNPVFSIGDQIAEVLQIHQKLTKGRAWQQAVDLLRQVGLPDAESRAHAYPHEISGGQAQRVMIAIALALRPQLLIADEPTTALDVTIQAQILDLLRELSRRWGTAVVLITHDLGVMAEMADSVAVMYAGRIVEQAHLATLFDRPLHPYTQGLIASIPVLGDPKDRLEVIPGAVPDLIDIPPGCRFAGRCRLRVEFNLDVCTRVEPDLAPVGIDHAARCWLYLDDPAHGHKAPLRSSLIEQR
ncbi:MAG TPA: ABC transporter ATP-binding protein [Anaerolineales bacterium]|nr:ABC transporter ATP-binding protein [Anaerolineales bacterium]